MNVTVKIAQYRAEADHLFRIANVDYQACVSVREIEYWKEIAERVLAQVKELSCARATAYDREQFEKAVSALSQRLIDADTRIAQLKRPHNDRIFVGIFPAGVGYADRKRERHGDYVRLAFLSFATLELIVERDCPPEFRRAIVADAAAIQARKGEEFQVSACGQTVLLGSAIKPC